MNTTIAVSWLAILLVAATAGMAIQPYTILSEPVDADSVYLAHVDESLIVSTPQLSESKFIIEPPEAYYPIHTKTFDGRNATIECVHIRPMQTKDILDLNWFDSWSESEQELLVEMMAATAMPSNNPQEFNQLLDNATVRVMETYIDLLENSGVV